MHKVRGIYGSLNPYPGNMRPIEDGLVIGPEQPRKARHVATNLHWNNFSHPPRVFWRTVRRKHYG